MPPNRFESEVESFLEGSHGDRTHIKRADHPRLHHYAGRYFFSRSSNRGIPRGELCCAVALVVGPSTGSVNPSMRCYTLLVAWWAACPRNHLSG